MKEPTTFLDFWQLGFKRLVPIIPPKAPISERSSLFKRVGTPGDSRGKAVGIRGRDGAWRGFDWLPYEADEEDLRRWQSDGAGVGIKTGKGLIALDADTLDANHARTIRDIVERHIGRTPIRVGRFPKALYLVRVSEPLAYTRVEFGKLNEKGRLTDRVEILSDNRQFVASGIHPATGNPYHWPRGIVPCDELPVFPSAAILALMSELHHALPAATPLITEGSSTSTVDQETLKGDLDKVRKAVELIPNTGSAFASREDYLNFGYAVKAALPDNPDEAFELFSDWCERWTDGENDPEVIEADWRRMRGPYRRGANWIYELAERHAPEKFSRAEIFFSPIEDSTTETSAFDIAAKREAAADREESERLEPIAWINPQDWHGVEPPPRKWIVDGMVPDGEVTLLTGRGGVGKTLLAQQLATCVSKGLAFLGHETVECKVMAFLCEDAPDELHLRQQQINNTLALDMQDIAPNLRIASRKFMDNLLASFDRNTGTMKRTAVWKQFCEDAKAWGAKLVIVDTIADTFGGSEIDRSQVRQFVQACLGKLAQEIGGACLALGHPSKSGESTGDGTSGSTAWHASVRSRLYLEHAAKDGSGPLRRLSNKKANYGPAGDVMVLRWSRGAFELVSAKHVPSSAEGEGQTGVQGMAAAIDDAIIAGVATLEAAGAQMSLARNSPYWAVTVLRMQAAELLGAYTKEEVEEGLNRALKAGRVREAVVGRKADRKPRLGLSVVPFLQKLTSEDTPKRMSDDDGNTGGDVFH